MANRYPLIVDTTIKEIEAGDVLVADNLTLSGTTPTLTIAATGVMNIPTGTTAQRPGSAELGSFRYNTTDGSFEGNSASGWGEIGGGGANLTTNNYDANGVLTAFTLGIDPSVEQNTFVYIDGVYQFKNTYSTSGTTLTFSTAPPNGAKIEVMSMTATNSVVGTVSDNAITTAKIANLNVTNAKMAANSVDSAQYVDGSIDVEHLADNSIDEASLYADNNPTNDYVLTAKSSVTGGLTWAASGGLYNTWLVKDDDFNAASGDQLICNHASTPFEITLPAASEAAPSNVGDTVTICNAGAALVTIGKNSSLINSADADGTLPQGNSVQLVYVDDTIGWFEV